MKTSTTLSRTALALFAGFFLVSAVFVLAAGTWVGPTEAPPGGNIDTTFNVGNNQQSKLGGLTLNTSASPFIVGLVVLNGQVGIGMSPLDGPAPGLRLEVRGGTLKATGGLITEAVGTDPVAPQNGRLWLGRQETSSGLNFPDQYGMAIGHCGCSSCPATFYATFSISNPSPTAAVFNRTSFNPTCNESAPSSFTVNANSTLVRSGFGNVTVGGACPDVPQAACTGTGSATYTVTQLGVTRDTVTYSWDYPF